MNKVVIYTSLTGGYDNLPQYKVTDPEFDYICFTNDFPDSSRQGIWKIHAIPIELSNKISQSRYVKLQPHKVLEIYEYSLWLDSNIIVTDKCFYEKVKSKIDEGGLWYGIKHPFRDCIYEEARACIEDGRSGLWETRSQINFLREKSYPRHFGLLENNIILRNHCNSKVVEINDEWWSLFQNYTRRDQLSLYYIFWKNNFQPKFIFDVNNNSRNTKGLQYLFHKKASFSKRITFYIRKSINRILSKLISL